MRIRHVPRSAVGVVIVAGVRVYRESLAAALEPLERVVVQGTAEEWSEAFGYIHGRHPDIVLVDANLIPEGRGVRLLAHTTPHVRLVALAVPEDEVSVVRCLEAGVSAYVRSDAPLAELIETIERAAGGELLCSPRIAGALGRRLSDLAAEREPSTDVARLTTREIEVVHLIEQGMSNQEIADRLFIEVATVKNHVHHILAKLHIRSRADAASWVRGANGLPRG
jgi:two-component system, NarL family, nitrate/nitrite response regulator NarL